MLNIYASFCEHSCYEKSLTTFAKCSIINARERLKYAFDYGISQYFVHIGVLGLVLWFHVLTHWPGLQNMYYRILIGATFVRKVY